MKKLTTVEEQVMKVIWQMEKGFVKDFIEQLPEPKPPYSTISSVVRILEKKGFVGHTAYGKTHQYFPIISQESYRAFLFKGLFTNYFNSNKESLLSFFAEEEDMSLQDLQDLIKNLKKIKKQ